MRSIAVILFVLGMVNVHAQQNIPNGDFEDWGFTTTQQLAKWMVVGNVSVSNDAHEGSKAIRLENDADEETPGFITTGAFAGDKLMGIPYNEQPLSVRFWSKFDLALGDQAQVACLFYFKGNAIGVQSTLIEGNSADTFQYFSLPITWQVSTNPDSVAIVISSKDLENDTYNGDGYMIVDDFHFASISTRNKEVPNGNFESWTDVKHPHLNSWFTTDEYLRILYGSQLPTPFVKETTDGRSGTKGLELTNQRLGDDIIAGIAFTGVDFESVTDPAFPIDNKWKYLEGYYKYTPSGGDSVYVAATLFSDGIDIGRAVFNTSDMASKYTYFSVEIDYYRSGTPDSASVFVASANAEEPRGETSKLIIDDLQFSDHNASVFDISHNKLTVYPNPFTDHIRFSGIDQMLGATYTLVDMLGNTVATGELTRNLNIDLSESLPGVYVLHLNGKHVNTSKILLKE
ncbi:MAG: T9SS type A sorting domain-containing protein [Bacteroidia bacterium]|nr:T9SS type A sorting domain-containing protein [Bacteroidia bacterium]